MTDFRPSISTDKGHAPRLFLVDIWITIALTFVIIGHCSVTFAPSWYHMLKKWIYSFHMGSFFFISGFLMHYTRKPMESFHDYISIISKKCLKFTIPFLIFGTLLSLVPLTQHHFSHKSLKTALNLFYRPTASYVIFLWFLYVLFEYYLIAPLISRFYNPAIVIFLLVGILLAIKTIHCDRFALYLFSRHFLFVVLGIIAAENVNVLRCLPHIPVYLAACAFLYASWLIPKYHYPASGVLGLPFMLSLSWICAPLLKPIRPIVELISRNSFGIYLYQMIVIQILARFFAFLPNPSILFPLFLILAVPAAIIFTLAVNKALRLLSTRFHHRAVH
jgi:fucose 4-O-acetylase-like acetyltransferase